MVITDQSISYINKVRLLATELLELSDKIPGIGYEWNTQFGGVDYLIPLHFVQDDEGLNKTDIENAKGVLEGIISWLGTGSNRVYLQKIRNS